MYYILNDDGTTTEVDINTYTYWLINNSYKTQIVKTYINSRIFLSTIFLGINHSTNTNKPILFESLWFNGKLDGDIQRYSTLEEAKNSHRQMIFDYYTMYHNMIKYI